jgi:hypothetical protein
MADELTKSLSVLGLVVAKEVMEVMTGKKVRANQIKKADVQKLIKTAKKGGMAELNNVTNVNAPSNAPANAQNGGAKTRRQRAGNANAVSNINAANAPANAPSNAPANAQNGGGQKQRKQRAGNANAASNVNTLISETPETKNVANNASVQNGGGRRRRKN